MKRRTYKGKITKLPANGIAVVGTNWDGRHSAGAAKWALDNAGAIYGHAIGFMNCTYGLVTKDLRKRIHPSVADYIIKAQIRTLYAEAVHHPTLDFYIFYSATGINLNGYTGEQMAEMFDASDIPENIIFEEEFCKLLKHGKDREEGIVV